MYDSKSGLSGRGVKALCRLCCLLPCLVLPMSAFAEVVRVERVAELFTSHGCSSCPSADELLGQLSKHDESLLLLEFHVDYWNGLVHGSDGSFADPYSDERWSLLQRNYSRILLKGRPGIYTPQAVVNGRYAVVGSDAYALNKTLRRGFDAITEIQLHADEEPWRVALNGNDAVEERFEVWVYRFHDRTVTDVTGGENNGRQLENHNVVYEGELLGEWRGNPLEFSFASAAPGQGCAVLLRARDAVGVHAAARCP